MREKGRSETKSNNKKPKEKGNKQRNQEKKSFFLFGPSQCFNVFLDWFPLVLVIPTFTPFQGILLMSSFYVQWMSHGDVLLSNWLANQNFPELLLYGCTLGLFGLGGSTGGSRCLILFLWRHCCSGFFFYENVKRGQKDFAKFEILCFPTSEIFPIGQ